MLAFLSDSTMLEMLEKVQPLQIEILKTGRDAHVDASIHESILDRGKTHISFEVTVFEDLTIAKSFEFNSNETEDVLNATYDLLVAYVKYIQANV